MKADAVIITIALIAVVGLWLMVTALMRLRSGRLDRVCPLCRYDLSKVPGRRCIECGFEARAVDDFYPGEEGWGRLALGLLVLTPGIAMLWTVAWTDTDSKAILWHARWVFRLGALAVFLGVLTFVIRTLIRDFRLQRRHLPHKRGRNGRLALGVLVMAHAVFAAFAPRGVQSGWSSVPPPPVKNAVMWVIDQFKRP